MSITRRTTVYFEDATHGQFPLPFDGEFYRETLQVSPDGLTATLGMLCADGDAEDPFDGDEGEFYQFDSRSIHYMERPELDEFKRIIRANPGRVFLHNGTGDWHGPGTVKCYATHGPFTVADTKGVAADLEQALDRSGGYYIAPEDVTDPAKYAKGALEQYSQWCNGEVYGVLVYTYTRTDDGEWELDNRDDECWGYIGAEYAAEELADQMGAK